MASNLATWGNKLHSGEKTYPIVGQRKRWFAVSGILMLTAVVILLVKGLNLGIDFTGGAQYIVPGVNDTSSAPAEEVVGEIVPNQEPRITVLGEDDLRIQLGEITADQQEALTPALADAYGVDEDTISFDQIGPTWGAAVGQQALQGLLIFLLLVFAVISIYFRAWRMAAAAIIALLHDLLFTVGIYALSGFEVTPASVIGFLTILGYSLYDTVVVFDKVKENTQHFDTQMRYSYAELANLAVNQTLVRSINTSVVALLPVTSILFIGSFILGAGTLKDIALALFVGMAVGTYSSIFVATPLEVALRSREPKIAEHTAKVLALRESGEVEVATGEDGTVRVGALKPGEHRGQASQPKRKGRK
ncbi:protein translocase subunit SecF [Demequina globuliformis]|uniref:protein translocase subunit SecF n=1 Tax=Demequina globuliformis TaxID=676202 RepID=UPI0007846D89|nr:protein translocase subunit SecF [Demequina globuliformis]